MVDIIDISVKPEKPSTISTVIFILFGTDYFQKNYQL